MDLGRPKRGGTRGDRTQMLTATELLPEEGKLSIPRGTRSLALSKEASRMRQKGCDRSHGSHRCRRVHRSSAVPWGQPELGPGNTPCSTKTPGQVGTQPKHQAADPLGHQSRRKGAKQLCWEGGSFPCTKHAKGATTTRAGQDLLGHAPARTIPADPVASLRSEARTTYRH